MTSTARDKLADLPGVAWRSMRRLPHLSWGEIREELIIGLLAIAAEIAIRTVTLDRAIAMFGLRADVTTREHPTAEPAELPRWATDRLRKVNHVMRRWPVDGECLRQALVAGHRLRSLGPTLRIGVARKDGAIAAHAWLEVGGRSLDPTSAQYRELSRPTP